jgi:hypothetical protein
MPRVLDKQQSRHGHVPSPIGACSSP